MHMIRRNSKYQEIVIDLDAIYRGEHILYLDGAWQYASMFEYRYHEIMTMMAYCTPNLDRVLICGGGDGLAAREILKQPNVHVDLVEIDGDMIDLYSTEKMLVDLNKGSLLDKRLHVQVADAFQFAKEAERGSYDLVLLDFPSPGEGNRSKNYFSLFSRESAELFSNLVKEGGALVSQTSVAAETLVGFARHFLDTGHYMWSYDAVYNSSGNHDTFIAASKWRKTKERSIPKDCRLITDDHLRVGFSRTTEITMADLDYFRLFDFVEAIDAEQHNGISQDY